MRPPNTKAVTTHHTKNAGRRAVYSRLPAAKDPTSTVERAHKAKIVPMTRPEPTHRAPQQGEHDNQNNTKQTQATTMTTHTLQYRLQHHHKRKAQPPPLTKPHQKRLKINMNKPTTTSMNTNIKASSATKAAYFTNHNKLIPSQHNINKANKIAATTFKHSDIFPSSIPIKEDAGKCGLMWPRGKIANSHPAAQLLNFYSTKGCPVDTGTPWTKPMILAALKRGPHISAKVKAAQKYLKEETQEKLKGGYIKIVKWGDIKNKWPKNLKISPIAMIPHKSRSYRCILDLSFKLKVNGTKINSVNDATKIQSPQKSMAQLGWVIKRIITTLANNFDTDKPFMFSKCDIKDGFWRMSVNKEDAWNFCYTLPTKTKTTKVEDIEIVVPHALQMGWAESPPFFCAATETARDIIQHYFQKVPIIPPHPLESHLYSRDTVAEKQPDNTSSTQLEVYVDDFIALTNDNSRQHIQHLARAMLVGIHSIFPPPTITGHSGEDPISNKKLLQHEGLFEQEKEILGWIINGKNYSIRLPLAKITKIQDEISAIIKKKKVPSNTLEKIQGRLIHASIGIPGGRGLMSPLYAAQIQTKEFTSITPQLKQCLQDWKELVKVVNSRETSVLELVPQPAEYIGYVDASKTAVGGVWTNGTKTLTQQWVWRLEWPMEIQQQLVSANNKQGTLSINDLEMAGVLLAWLALEHIIPTSLQGIHVGIFCDNMSTVTWTNKKSTSTSKIAGHLLRALALRQHINRSSPLAIMHIEGKQNIMADVASRSFHDSTFTKSNKSFLQNFQTLFPLQNTSWQEFHLPKKLASRVISCLHGKPLAMASWTKITTPEKNIGDIGQTTPRSSEWINSWKNVHNKRRSSSSQPLLQGSGQATTAKVLLSELHQSHKRLLPYPRPLNWLANNRQSTKQKKFTKQQWHGKWKDTKDAIHPQHHN